MSNVPEKPNASDSGSNSFFDMVLDPLGHGKTAITTQSIPVFETPAGLKETGSIFETHKTSGETSHEEAFESVPSIDTENSGMPHEARRVLVHLMRQGVIIASQKPKLFELLCRYEVQVRRHLSEVYLQLMLDQKSGLAFVASFSDPEQERSESAPDEDEFLSLIPKRTLSLYDTLLLLVLRKHYQDRESSGEQKIIIDVERLESYLTPFLPLTNHEKSDRKKLEAAIKRLISKKLLSFVRGAEDRYEITPVIRYVVNAAFLESMLIEYQKLAEEL